MKYCPDCEAEYRDDISICADCEIPLISSEEFSSMMKEEEQIRENLGSQDFIPIKVAENSFEADRLKATLEEAGIPVLVRLFEDTAYDGIYVAQQGWAHIEVPETEKKKAEKIIEEMDLAFPEVPSAEEEEEEDE